MNELQKNMRLLKNKSNERLVYLFLYYNSQLSRLANNSDVGVKYKYSIQEIATTLDMDRSNTWNYVKQLEKKGLIDVVKFEKTMEVLL